MTTTVLPEAPAAARNDDPSGTGPLPTRRGAFAGGIRAMLPNLLGIVPLGIAVGTAAAGSGLPDTAGWAASLLIYSGSAQFAAIDLLAHGASAVVVLTTVLVINARLLLYSAAMATRWRGMGRPSRLLAAYLLIDPSFIVGTQGYEQRRPAYAGHAHYFGGACLLWVSWQLATLTGSTICAVVPAGLHLDFLVPLYLVGLLVPKLTSGPVRAGASVGAAAALAGSLLPLHLGLAVGIVAGLAVALAKEKVR